MADLRKIAFYAPIKPPDHPIPSGDRLIAGNIMKALNMAGYDVEMASRYIAYSKHSDVSILEERKAEAEKEAGRIIDELMQRPLEERPQVWITYHPYCKAPDWIGVKVTNTLGISYINIEAARTNQGINDEWKPWRSEAQLGIKQADKHFYFKQTDLSYLSSILDETSHLKQIPVFIETKSVNETRCIPAHWDKETQVIVTTGMMRPGKKLQNFEIIKETLKRIEEQDWNLIVIGGGPELDNIREDFSSLGEERLHFTGQVEHHEVLEWMNSGDIFFWPGWKEPIGMVYLEAQMHGLPVIAYDSMGVPLVVDDGATGLLAPEGDIAQMQDNLTSLLKDKALREKLGAAAQTKVRNQHSLEVASKCFKTLIDEVLD